MSPQDIGKLVSVAKTGQIADTAALIMAIARDLRTFIASYAASPAMLEDVHAATWMQVRREINNCPPSSQVNSWIRQRAMVILQQRLNEERNQAVIAKDALLHLAAQDGFEAIQSLASPTNDHPNHINAHYAKLDELSQSLIYLRYHDHASLETLAQEFGLASTDEVALKLYVARACLHWHTTAKDQQPPDDQKFPVHIEQLIAKKLTGEARQHFAQSLLKDLARAANFSRQMRVDLLLRSIFGDISAENAHALAQNMAKIENKSRNESSLLHVPAPERTPVGSGSELIKSQNRIAERQTRITETPLQSSRAGSRKRSKISHERSFDAPRKPGGKSLAPVLLGSGVVALGIIVMVVIWGGSGDRLGSGNSNDNAAIGNVLGVQGTFDVIRGSDVQAGHVGTTLNRGEGIQCMSGSTTVELNGNTRVVAVAETRVRAFDRLQDGTGQVYLDQGTLEIQTMSNPGIEVRSTHARISFGVAKGKVTVENGRTQVYTTTGSITVSGSDGEGTTQVPPGNSVIIATGAAPRLIRPKGYVRGINFGGNQVTIDGQRWVAHRQALSAGLTLQPGTAIGPNGSISGAGLDFDHKLMLDTGLNGRVGVAAFSQVAPKGDYDITLWITNTTPNTGDQLSIHINDKQIALANAYFPRSGWAKVGPLACSNTGDRLAVVLDGIATSRLSGVLIEASDAENVVLPAAIAITSPFDAASFSNSEEFTIRADVIGKVTSVQFFADDTLLGEVSAPPYQFKTTITEVGNHKLTVKGTTPGQAPSVSLPLGIRIVDGPATTPKKRKR